MITDDMEEVELGEVEMRKQHSSYSREAYEQDDEAPRTGVQCQTQWSLSEAEYMHTCAAVLYYGLSWDTNMQVKHVFHSAVRSITTVSFVL